MDVNGDGSVRLEEMEAMVIKDPQILQLFSLMFNF